MSVSRDEKTVVRPAFREDAGAQSWRFYEEVPWGLAFLSSACTAVCVFSVEMVGILQFSIFGGGCSVGTPLYKEYVKILESSPERKSVVDLKDAALTQCETVGKKVQWTTEPVDGFYYKVIRYDLFHKDRCPEHGVARGENWRRLYAVYKAYSNAVNGMDEKPNALVPASLLFGEFQVSILGNVGSALPTSFYSYCVVLDFFNRRLQLECRLCMVLVWTNRRK